MIVNPTIHPSTEALDKARLASQKVLAAYISKHPELSKEIIDDLHRQFDFAFDCYEIGDISKFRTSEADEDYKEMIKGMREYAILRVSYASEYLIEDCISRIMEDGRPRWGLKDSFEVEESNRFYAGLEESLKDYNGEGHLKNYKEEYHFGDLIDAIEDLGYVDKFSGIDFDTVSLKDVA